MANPLTKTNELKIDKIIEKVEKDRSKLLHSGPEAAAVAKPSLIEKLKGVWLVAKPVIQLASSLLFFKPKWVEYLGLLISTVDAIVTTFPIPQPE